MRTVRIAITGAGNVGRRIAATIRERRADFASRLDVDIRVVGICTSRSGIVDPDGLSEEHLDGQTHHISGLTGRRFLDLVSADVLIEAGPSNYDSGEPGIDYLRGALARSMDVVCVSKGALVVAGAEIHRLAAQHGRQVRVSGAAASAMPTVDFLTYDLAGSGVTRVEALLTGTTTFVLDQMHRHDVGLKAAIGLAQQRGIAEPQPEFDIDGWDTAAKLVVIARAAFGLDADIDEVPRASVADVTTKQLERWRNKGSVPRLVGILDRTPAGDLTPRVEIRAYAADHPFSLTAGSMKALSVATERMGDYVLLGGASSPDATAAAAIKDVEHILAADSDRPNGDSRV